MNNLISMNDLSRDEILELVQLAGDIEEGRINPSLKGTLTALLFFEPSTRTSFSFDAAAKRLGGATLIMSGTGNTSVKKGETLADTLRTIAEYADLIVMRNRFEGAARYASEQVGVPVINAGDGANQHPTQALLDLYSIAKTQGTLENLTVGLVGDLRYGRTVHSLVQALSPFKPKFHLLSPAHLALPDYLLRELDNKGIPYEQSETIESAVPDMDIMYVTRIQRERFPDQEEYERLKGSYIIRNATLEKAKKNMKLLHPLPRVEEIATEVDDSPRAYYFPQAKNGMYMRQAILSTLLEVL